MNATEASTSILTTPYSRTVTLDINAAMKTRNLYLASFFMAFFSIFSIQAQDVYIQAQQPKITATWEYVDGEKGVFETTREIMGTLSSEMEGFANPRCLHDKLLNHPRFQTYVALGSQLIALHYESIEESTAGKGVVFSTEWEPAITGWQPFTFCKIRR